MPASFVVGIDLGTSNCAVAYAAIDQTAPANVQDFPVPQLQRPGQVAAQPLLPSTLYLPAEHELAPGATALPWGEAGPWVVGEYARWQGARVPGRLVASAKSWLCHSGVDRTAPILPWGAPSDVQKISPVTASTEILRHIVRAWNATFPTARLEEQEVVVTVPASFDEVARALTVSAAREAGLEKFTLLEEPQAAFYAFTADQEERLTESLAGVRLVLVADVGGGTTDFTLIHVSTGEGNVVLKRVAVGEHLLLGGDNMDAALARLAEEKLRANGHKLNASQWTQLSQAARVAKETLLSIGSPDHAGIAIAGSGSKLLGNTLSTTIQKTDAEERVLDGFFPYCGRNEAPKRSSTRVALQELGLPYAQDTAIPRHLVAFLTRHATEGSPVLARTASSQAASGEIPRPDAILLNGGVFNSPSLAQRFVDVVSAWWPDQPRIPLLQHGSLDLAVARGAARYGLVRRGLGRRIGGGIAQSFYVGIAAEDSTQVAVCVIPRGTEEGQTISLVQRPFTLSLGRPVQFPLYSTAAHRVDRAGEIVAPDDSFHRLPALHTLFKASGNAARSLPVHLEATLTELGTLELWCVANAGTEKWRLEFELRNSIARIRPTVTESMPERFEEVKVIVERIYGPTPQTVDPKEVKQLSSSLETAIGSRETWRLPLLRELWSTLFAGAAKRRRSPAHERTFLRLLGYSIRPGFGYPLDEWRCEQTFRLFGEYVNAHQEHSVWNEFWILWRRVAGGLTPEQQLAVWAYLKPHLARRVPLHPVKNAARPKGLQPEGLDEMIRLAASLEHLPSEEKAVFGDWIIGRLKNPTKAGPGPWAWALGRLGTRAPVYGSGHRTVDQEKVSLWLTVLLEVGLDKIEGAPFAAVQLARMTGDRTRDIDPELRARTLSTLAKLDAPIRWREMVERVTELNLEEEQRVLGDSLPVGLSLAQK